MSFEWLIARRYLWSKRRHPFAGVMSTVSVLGICVGVAALIVVLAVMNGFDEDLKHRIIGTRAHLVIERDGLFSDPAPVIKKLGTDPEVAGVSAFVEGQALIQAGEWGSGILVRGIDTIQERKVSRFYHYLTQGSLSENIQTAAIGSELAHRAGLRIGSRFQIATQSMQKPLTVTVEGIFSSGLYEYDANLVFMSLKNAQNIFGLDNSVNGVSVYLKDADKADSVRKRFARQLGYPYFVRTWMDLNRTLFSALQLEKTVMFIILALIVFVACLNIAGSLTILVMDKTRDVGILKALGARPLSLVKVFLMDGLAIGGIGGAFGFGIGLVFCVLLSRYQFIDLPKEIYYVNKLPVSMSVWDTSVILVTALALSILSSLYPAMVAGKLDPVKALRYE